MFTRACACRNSIDFGSHTLTPCLREVKIWSALGFTCHPIIPSIIAFFSGLAISYPLASFTLSGVMPDLMNPSTFVLISLSLPSAFVKSTTGSILVLVTSVFIGSGAFIGSGTTGVGATVFGAGCDNPVFGFVGAT